MNYTEAIEAVVALDEARTEIGRHCAPEYLNEQWADFVADCGDHPEYPGETVLGWLGY